MTAAPVELVCPAGTPAALEAAVDAGADTVYLGFRDATNARNFPGLNFSRDELRRGLAYAHARGRKVYLAINTFPHVADDGPWRSAVDDAATLGVDALILADIGLLAYAAAHQPALRRHLSVQASAAHPLALEYYVREFGISRVVLPRVLTVSQVKAIAAEARVETEVFVYGGLCPMAEGRCALSSYATGRSPNTFGVCSPASHVQYLTIDDALVARLGDFTINRFAAGESPGYPTLCKGRFEARGRQAYLFEDPVSLDARPLIPEFAAAGVRALKIEGRQRGRAYVAQVVRALRAAVDAAALGQPASPQALTALSEGGQDTSGAYRKGWR